MPTSFNLLLHVHHLLVAHKLQVHKEEYDRRGKNGRKDRHVEDGKKETKKMAKEGDEEWRKTRVEATKE